MSDSTSPFNPDRLRAYVVSALQDANRNRKKIAVRLSLIFSASFINASALLTLILPDLSFLPDMASGLVFLVPVLNGLLVGILMSDESYKKRAMSGFYVITISGLIVFLSLYWPIISGIATDFGFYFIWSMKWLAISLIILFPTTLMGVLIGSAGAEY